MLPLSREQVRYVGEPVVAIAAESQAAAVDAAERSSPVPRRALGMNDT
jgi:CO/xanthine dehydrogenase Mo-binding subunit